MDRQTGNRSRANDEESRSDDDDPLPKSYYREMWKQAHKNAQEANQRVHELDTGRDEWRARIRAEVDAQYAARVTAAQRESAPHQMG